MAMAPASWCRPGPRPSMPADLRMPMPPEPPPQPVRRLQTAQYSTQIFSLAVLLSSLFVYNQVGMWAGNRRRAALDGQACRACQHTRILAPPTHTHTHLGRRGFPPVQMGGIDEAALDRLSLVTEMTKHIRVGGRVDA